MRADIEASEWLKAMKIQTKPLEQWNTGTDRKCCLGCIYNRARERAVRGAVKIAASM